MDQKCGGCRFGLDRDTQTVFCRRYPPQNLGNIQGGYSSNFPIMMLDGWCGEYQVKPIFVQGQQ